MLSVHFQLDCTGDVPSNIADYLYHSLLPLAEVSCHSDFRIHWRCMTLWLAMSTFRNVHSVCLRLRGTGLRSSVLICCDYNDIVLIYVFNGILGIEPDCLLAHGLLFSIYWRYWSLLQLTPRQFLCTRPLRGFLTNKANNFVVSIGKGLVYSEVKHKCTVIILWTSKSR